MLLNTELTDVTLAHLDFQITWLEKFATEPDKYFDRELLVKRLNDLHKDIEIVIELMGGVGRHSPFKEIQGF